MVDIKIMEVVDTSFRKKYKPTTKLVPSGHQVSNANVILKYKDGDLEISIKLSKKQALQVYFDSEKSQGKYKNVDYDKFLEKFEAGLSPEEIEEAIKKEQLQFDKAKKGEKK